MRSAALAFSVKHSSDVIERSNVVSTEERIQGLLHLRGETLVIQWRTARRTDTVGMKIASEESVDAVREITLPLANIATAAVRQPWPAWLRKPRLVLTAADLRAFEGLVGAGGLQRTHPAELSLPLDRRDRLAALEFAADLNLALAEQSRVLPRAPSFDA